MLDGGQTLGEERARVAGGELAGRALGAPGGLGHGVGLGAGDRSDGGGERLAAGRRRNPGAGQHGGRRMRVRADDESVGRAAGRAGAQVRPAPAVLDPQEIVQPDPGSGQDLAGLVGERGDERAGPVADQDGVGELVPGKQDGRVADDLRGHGGVGRVRQVEPEREPHPAIRARHGEDNQAAVGVEAEQEGDDGDQGVRGADLDPGGGRGLRVGLRVHGKLLRESEGTGGPRGPARPLGMVRTW